MANLDFYKRELGISDTKSIADYLCSTCIETNHTYGFFVGWDKVNKNRDELKIQAALLGTLKGTKDSLSALVSCNI
jgi:hypothetical protein